MAIKRFEDIEGWKEARVLMNLVCDVTEREIFNSRPRLRSQMEEAAGGIMANIAEGFDSGTDFEFRRLLRIAQRSATEIQSHLYRCIDRHMISGDDFPRIYRKCTEVRNLIRGFIKYLSRSRKAPSK